LIAAINKISIFLNMPPGLLLGASAFSEYFPEELLFSRKSFGHSRISSDFTVNMSEMHKKLCYVVCISEHAQKPEVFDIPGFSEKNILRVEF
jgi:hypothetical protein